MNIYEKIKKARIDKKITQGEVAEILGISQAAYAKIEKPKNPENKKLSIEYGELIAKKIGVSFNELFEIENTADSSQELLKQKNHQLELRISELEEQLRDKKTIIDFIEKQDIEFLRAIAHALRYKEVNKNPDSANSGEWGFDRNNKESLMKYISSIILKKA